MEKINWSYKWATDSGQGVGLSRTNEQSRFSCLLKFEVRTGCTSHTIMFLTKHIIGFSIKSSWLRLHNTSDNLISVRMDQKMYTISCVFYTTHQHPNLEVSQTVFSSEKQDFSPVFPGNHCKAARWGCWSLIYSSSVGRGVLQRQQKWSHTKTQQLENSTAVSLHLKPAVTAGTGSFSTPSNSCWNHSFFPKR